MQSDLTYLIRPSVEAYLFAQEDPAAEASRILGHQRGEGICDVPTLERIQAECDAEVARLGVPWAVAAIAEHAEGVGLTSNGGGDIYLDSGGWCEVPFVSDEE
jgi:hypothetical protein